MNPRKAPLNSMIISEYQSVIFNTHDKKREKSKGVAKFLGVRCVELERSHNFFAKKVRPQKVSNRIIIKLKSVITKEVDVKKYAKRIQREKLIPLQSKM